MSERARFLEVNPDDMTIHHAIEPGKVVLLILDGHQGKAKAIEAVHHGHTIIETAKGKTARIRFEESELF
ncbi:XtrA/YqaO family protein [Priestia flexa]|uniref:XtrA/YqaO family protein n=1 Tax=Priestia flexa TaxID=86664 RepID=A0A8I1MBU9_9BACI|nr:XtrA/YqaO family protein [Priestia flexa]MBN8249971.1 XtrA/YqaO family protein [Priestia flexa]